MQVAYLTVFDSNDPNAWSGTGKFILDTLRNQGVGVGPVGKLSEKWRIPFLAMRRAYRLLGYCHLQDREPVVLHGYAKEARGRLEEIEHDLVFSPGTLPIAYLESDRPIVFWTDTTFASIVDYYPAYTGLSSRTIANGTAMEQAALSRASLAIYSSEWAARSAIDNYRVDPAKVRVIPFGANLPSSPATESVKTWIRERLGKPCRLLFVGVDWDRKGGDIAVEVAASLNRRGVETELLVVGCEPPASAPAFVKRFGRLSKRDPAHYQTLARLFGTASFFILPTRAEAFGIVFAEASAFGLPSIATDTGGVASAVESGRNGQLFAPESPASEIADYIESVWNDQDEYLRLALSSLEVHQSRLNWNSAGAAVKRLLDDLVKPSSR